MAKGSQNFQKLYKKLNTEQKRAVNVLDGPILVIAGPGTGKTQVLTMRIANILLKTDTPPDAVLALTFTEAGVRAMRERLLSIIGTTAYYVNIHTFHSFSSDIIKSNPDEFVLSTQIEPLSDLERIHIFKEIIDELKLKAIKPFNAPYFYLRASIAKIQNLKREGIDTKEYDQYIKDGVSKMEAKDINKNKELNKVYELYQKKLQEYGRYDFEDMINYVIDKFKKSPEFLAKYQERFQYFLVDEFQDTNSAQAELLYQLNSYWGDNPNLFIVGDDDQSIFRFQGASVENIIDFNERYPDSKKIVLTKNYRNTQPILDSAQNVISNNAIRISNKLKIDKSQKSQVPSKSNKVINIGEFSSSYTENHYIATKIKELIKSDVAPREIAVIYRNNMDAIDIADMLSRLGVKYTLEGGENVLESGIIIRLLHLLRTIQRVRTNEEGLDMFSLLNYEFIDMDPLDVLRLSRFAASRKVNFFEALSHKDFQSAEFKYPDKLKDFSEKLVLWNKMASNTTFIDFLENIMEESGFIDWILNHPNSYELLNKLNSFLSEVKRLNYSKKTLELNEFLHYIDLMQENKVAIQEVSVDVSPNTVRLSTAHKAKGLEFEYVFMPKFIDKKWGNAVTRDLIKLPPNILRTIELSNDKDRKKHKEEDERRLFFVVLTRAKKSVFITSAQKYQSAGFTKIGIPSMFLMELPDTAKNKVDVGSYEKDVSSILSRLLKNKKMDMKFTNKEKHFMNSTLQGFKLSASSLNNYLDCPYMFKLNNLLRVPSVKSRALILGSAIHYALEKTYKKIQKGQIVGYDQLSQLFTKALNTEILSKEEQNQIQEEGLDLINTYYNTYEEEFVPGHTHILFIEKWFGSNWSKPILDKNILLQGKIDKIELLDNTDKTIKIIDYKTGKPKSRKEILGETKYGDKKHYRQLLFYKLLIDLDKTINYKVKEVCLDFIGDRKVKPKRECFNVQDEQAEDLKNRIREVTKDIKNLKFERTKDYSKCRMCRFKFHCWPDGIPDQKTK